MAYTFVFPGMRSVQQPSQDVCPARDQQSPAADAGPSNGACAGTILPFEFRITASQLELVPDRGDSLLRNDEQKARRKILGQVSKIGDGLRVGETGPELVLDASPHPIAPMSFAVETWRARNRFLSRTITRPCPRNRKPSPPSGSGVSSSLAGRHRVPRGRIAIGPGQREQCVRVAAAGFDTCTRTLPRAEIC